MYINILIISVIHLQDNASYFSMDSHVEEKVKQVVTNLHITETHNVKSHLNEFVCNTVFKGSSPPPTSSQRLFPRQRFSRTAQIKSWLTACKCWTIIEKLQMGLSEEMYHGNSNLHLCVGIPIIIYPCTFYHMQMYFFIFFNIYVICNKSYYSSTIFITFVS